MSGRRWAYRPDPYDDWGMVRCEPDEQGRRWVVCQARHPFQTDSQLSEHRRNGTDPYAETACLIAAAPDMLGQLDSAQTDLDLLRRAIEEGDPKAELLIRVTDLWKRNAAAIAKALPNPDAVGEGLNPDARTGEV